MEHENTDKGHWFNLYLLPVNLSARGVHCSLLFSPYCSHLPSLYVPFPWCLVLTCSIFLSPILPFPSSSSPLLFLVSSSLPPHLPLLLVYLRLCSHSDGHGCHSDHVTVVIHLGQPVLRKGKQGIHNNKPLLFPKGCVFLSTIQLP